VKTRHVVALTALVGGLAFTVFGGEYSTINWWQLKRRVRAERRAVDSLRIDVDSLGRVAVALETDSATQEREARERFGMIRPGERMFVIIRTPAVPRP